jgi:hypothetical protein
MVKRKKWRKRLQHPSQRDHIGLKWKTCILILSIWLAKFTSMVEDMRKKEMMLHKTARQSLDFDSPPSKLAKYRHQRFTPPRHAAKKSGQCRTMMMIMMIMNVALCAHPKLALLVFVCRKGGVLLGPKKRRQVRPKTSSGGLRTKRMLKWPKRDSLKLCVHTCTCK